MNLVQRVCLLVKGRASRVTSRGSRVNGRGSRVNGRGSRVNGRGSRVTSRGSKNSSKLFLNVVKSNFRVCSSFRFLFYFTLTPGGTVCFLSLFQALVSWNTLKFVLRPGYTVVRVRTGPGKSGKSWNFIIAFFRTFQSWKKATGPGSSGNLLNSTKNMKCIAGSKEN